MATEVQNLLLRSLSVASRDAILARGRHVELVLRDVLMRADEPIEGAYFPNVGVCSVVMPADDGNVQGGVVEVATVGREGFLGMPLLLDTDETSAMGICQIPGSALHLPAADFRALVDADVSFRRVLLRYANALMTQMAQSGACNRVHNVEERAARWLLMTRDRVDDDTFPLTQEFLGQMLGVRRQAVNVAAGLLHQAGFITYSRGVVTILDRRGLEETACACYRIIRLAHERLDRPTRPPT